MVLVHGLGVSADYWWRNGPPLAAAGYRVLAPDLPGFGRTPGPRQGLSVGAQAEALARWADAAGVGPAVYVGHSLSCQSIVELAAAEPARVRGLVLAAPTGAPRRHPLLRQLWGLVLDVPRETFSFAVIVAQAYLRAGLVRVLRTWRMGAATTPLPLLPYVRAPGAVIYGDRDPVIDRDYAAALAAGLPDGELVCIPGGAHGLLYTSAPEFNAAVLRFLERVAVGGS